MSKKAQFNYYGSCKPIVERKRYFLWHVPKAVAALMNIDVSDRIDIFISTGTREILLRLTKEKK